MIIVSDLVVQLGMMAGFKRLVLQCDGAAIPMKYPSRFIVQKYLTGRDMHEV